MKILLKDVCALMLLLTFSLHINAQEQDSISMKDSVITQSRLKTGKIEPYWLTVTYDKTSHIIFPAKIKYVDLGSENLIAGKADAAENVLRVKAAVRNFESETNFSVITEDGRFYSFDVFYSGYPATLNYDVLKMFKHQDKEKVNDVLFEDLGSNRPTLTAAALKTIYTKNKKLIRHIGSYSFGISFLLKGIYIYDGKYYFHTELKNNTNVPYSVDFMTFKIVDRKTSKLTAVQENELVPLRSYQPLTDVPENRSERNVFLLDQFTLADDKVLMIEIFERNGGRHQSLEITNEDLIHASPVRNLKLVF
ncbi:conjugative transposon protein TraN [Pedobacter sp. ISL-68]|uniref:conjugative transposon protein TraN n=1 Tax=unclassified Pedobacter TaxID=2628915 RepID=UPI001BE82CE7|nr:MULTISPECIES: conjugative transposon protein TraN [unclassified Pedobacter]MBT2559821.1 conjugative transposon protein TraN [Pedobacter sp. ISL-64]MBT2592126.1 conjugative transposon protein TraN [Pedobacter sp. ISL-68]